MSVSVNRAGEKIMGGPRRLLSLLFALLHASAAVYGQNAEDTAGGDNATEPAADTTTTTTSVPTALNRRTSPEQRLYNALMANYSRDVRPSFDGRPVEIRLDPTLEHILHVRETDETIEYNQWWLIWWTDDHFQWDPAAFDGISYLYLHAGDIWQPDITAFEILSCERPIPDEHAVARVSSKGWVRMGISERCTITCPMRMENFPFDRHNCTIRYLSWMYPNTKVTVDKYGDFGLSTEANSHQEWNITGTGIEIKVDGYGVGDWQIAYCHFAIERRPRYYLLVLLTPMSLITALVILGLFSPAESTMTRIEKVNLGLTGLLAHAVLLITILESMPKTLLGVPYMGVYMLYQIFMVGLATFISTLLMYIQILGTMGYAVPKWLACCCLLNIDRLCCGRRRVHRAENGNGGRWNNTIPMTVSAADDGRHSQDGKRISKQARKVGELIAKVRNSDEDGAEGAVDGWALICFRLDIILLIGFELANLLMTLGFVDGPAKR